MFKSIVLATDGSAHAKKAARIAGDIAASDKARLTIVHVRPTSLSVRDIQASPRSRRFPKAVKADIDRVAKLWREARSTLVEVPAPFSAVEALGKAIVDEAKRIARGRKASRIDEVVRDGNDPADEIVKAAGRAKADLIVVGTRGLTDLRGLVMGSVSHKVMHLAKSAVLTVK